jgi:hypothetical protein
MMISFSLETDLINQQKMPNMGISGAHEPPPAISLA